MKRILFLFLFGMASAIASVASTLTVSPSQQVPGKSAMESIHVAVILPFALSSDKMTPERQKMLDFYKGVLITIDSLKHAGQSIEVTAIDEGPADNSAINSVVQNSMLKSADLIIGPGRNADVGALASFAQANHIPLVVPFANTANLANGRPYVFQCNPQVSTHYDKVLKRFVASHTMDNIIFMGMNDKADQNDYVIAFKKVLDGKGIPYHRMNFNEAGEKLKPILNASCRNVIIPSSSSTYSFDMLCLKLKDLGLQSYDIQLLGYPDWQTMHNKNKQEMAQFRATYFCTHYNNNLSSRTQSFCRTFEQNYQSAQYESYPRYGEMGHDISAFFLTALQRYGKSMLSNITSHDYNSLQMPFVFSRTSEQGGYVNTAVYQVMYKEDGSIILSTF